MFPWLGPFSSIAGAFFLFRRLGPALVIGAPSTIPDVEAEPQKVSILVPARNEESNLPKLLESLIALEGHEIEILVVDDESTDRSAAIISEFSERDPRVKLIRGQPRPAKWTGKNWACHQAYLQSKGEWLLFTDADTAHDKRSLRRAITRMRQEKLSLLSAVPFHRCEKWWEKILGPFYLLVLVSTAAFSKPRVGRLFAIGQYLLFRREAYKAQGGHDRIREFLCDDLELAHNCLREGGEYRVETQPLFDVTMYPTFKEFVNGWRRIIRLGFRHARFMAPVEIYFVICVLTASLRFLESDVVTKMLMFSCIAFMAIIQRGFGRFSLLGILLLPWSLAVFTYITLLSIWDLVRGEDFVWRGRSYKRSAD